MLSITKKIYAALALGAVSVTATAAEVKQPMSAQGIDLSAVDTNAFNAQPAGQKIDFTAQKRATALHIAQQYQQLKPVIADKISADKLNIALEELADSALDLTEFNFFNEQVIKAKGFDKKVQGLVELRLADKAMINALEQGQSPLFAFEPKGNEDSWSFVEAFDAQGNTHLLDVEVLPKRPVFVIDINSRTDMAEGVKIMRAVFAKMGQSPRPTKGDYETKAVLETTQLKKISLKDDEEPWISGKAEIYAIVTGIDSARSEPLTDVVDMPYLDHEDTNYYPNQIVIYWDRYRWNAADMAFMEQDDNTNYQDLAIQIANTAAQIMKVIPDPTVQGLSVLGTLTAELIKAMPSHWFSNDDDYVDTIYTIRKGYTYTNRYGAGANVKVNMAPLNLNN